MSQPATPTVAESSNLAVTAARGVLWTGGGQVVRQMIQIAGQLALVRLLAPDDFGLLGMAMFFIGIGQQIANFGVGSAIVQARTDDGVVLSSCFWLNIAAAGGLALLVLVCAPLIGSFYKRPDLTPLVALLSLNLLLSGMQVMPSSLLYRDMRFADLARAQVLGSLGGAVTAIGMAWAGAGVWALAAQPLVGTTINLLACWWVQRWLPRFEFSWRRVAPLARFSFALLGANLVGYGNRNVDNLLVGRVLGAGPLGLYSMAIQLMLYPLQQVSSVIVRVLFPTLVQIKDDLPRLRAAYVKAVSMIALVTFPLMTGMFALATDFVDVAFGPKWAGMVPVLRVLTWVGMGQSVGTTVGSIYLSTGNTGRAFRVSLVSTPVVVAGIVGGLPWGILGVAVGYAIASFSLFYFVAMQAFRLIDLSFTQFHAALARPLLAALGMCIVLIIVVESLQSLAPKMRLGLGVLVGIVVYAAVSFAINRDHLNDLWRILRSTRQRSDG